MYIDHFKDVSTIFSNVQSIVVEKWLNECRGQEISGCALSHQDADVTGRADYHKKGSLGLRFHP